MSNFSDRNITGAKPLGGQRRPQNLIPIPESLRREHPHRGKNRAQKLHPHPDHQRRERIEETTHETHEKWNTNPQTRDADAVNQSFEFVRRFPRVQEN